MTCYSAPLKRTDLAELTSRPEVDPTCREIMQRVALRIYNQLSDYRVLIEARKTTKLDILVAGKGQFIIRYNDRQF